MLDNVHVICETRKAPVVWVTCTPGSNSWRSRRLRQPEADFIGVAPLKRCDRMHKFLSKQSVFVVLVLLAAVLLGVYMQTRSRLAPGQEPLTDIQNVETLRAQFNKDVGTTRLIILVSPT